MSVYEELKMDWDISGMVEFARELNRLGEEVNQKFIDIWNLFDREMKKHWRGKLYNILADVVNLNHGQLKQWLGNIVESYPNLLIQIAQYQANASGENITIDEHFVYDDSLWQIEPTEISADGSTYYHKDGVKKNQELIEELRDEILNIMHKYGESAPEDYTFRVGQFNAALNGMSDGIAKAILIFDNIIGLLCKEIDRIIDLGFQILYQMTDEEMAKVSETIYNNDFDKLGQPGPRIGRRGEAIS